MSNSSPDNAHDLPDKLYLMGLGEDGLAYFYSLMKHYSVIRMSLIEHKELQRQLAGSIVDHSPRQSLAATKSNAVILCHIIRGTMVPADSRARHDIDEYRRLGVRARNCSCSRWEGDQTSDKWAQRGSSGSEIGSVKMDRDILRVGIFQSEEVSRIDQDRVKHHRRAMPSVPKPLSVLLNPNMLLWISRTSF